MITEFYFCTACKTTVLKRDIEWKIENEDIRGSREEISTHPELDAITIRCPNCDRIFAMTFRKKAKIKRREGQKTLEEVTIK